MPSKKSKIKMQKPSRAAKEPISLGTVLHVAKLSKLSLTNKEAKKYQKELNDILAAFDELRKIKTDAKPSFHPLDVKDVLRDDKEEKCYSNDAALQNTEHKEKGFFKGPRAV